MKYEIEKFYDDSGGWGRGLASLPVTKRAQNYINERVEQGWHVFQLTTTPRPNGDVTITVVMVTPGPMVFDTMENYREHYPATPQRLVEPSSDT